MFLGRLWVTVILAIGLFVGSVGSTFAEDASEAPLGFGAMAGVGAGVWAMDTSGFDDALRASGASGFDNLSPVYTVEVHGIALERIVFGGTGAIAQQRREGTGLEADLTTGFMTMDAGLIVFDKAGFRGYPVIGAGWGGAALETDGPASGDTGDDGAGGMGFGDADRRYGALIGRLAFNVDYAIPLTSTADYLVFVFTGARAGVFGEIATAGWSGDEGGLSRDPDFAFQGAFATLVFGFGGGVPVSMMNRMHEMHHGGHAM